MPLYSPPNHFIERLHVFDPLLRIRWSDVQSCWLIERKLTRGQWISPDIYTSMQYEDFVCARDGYVPVLFCEKTQLDERVFFTLWMGDIWRRGGAQTVADQMEANETQQQIASRAGWLDDVYNQAKEHYFTMNSLSPTRTSTDRGFS